MSIILEGPDGSGKTTLGQELQGHFPKMEMHPRFCTSKEGPIENLAEEVFKDIKSKPTHFIYDRHPCVSEYVYNSAIPERARKGIKLDFLTSQMERVRLRVAHHSLTVFCLPPFEAVKANIERDAGDQMPGVLENIFPIYQQYYMHYLMWPGHKIHYDYTQAGLSWHSLRYALAESQGTLWRSAK